MNKSKEALKRIETILQPNNIYKQYTDSATMFYKDCDCIRDDLDKLEVYENYQFIKSREIERIKGMIETKVIGGEITKEEKTAYVEHCVKKFGSNIELIEVELDGDYVNLKVHTKNEPFQRIRRITGYLVGTLDRFNDAKKDEVAHRVKHLSKKDFNEEENELPWWD